jgi:flavin-dependent dehydrogenase
MQDANTDVIVVGAGPAGASLAMRLARAGVQVALLDRAAFPRFKPCGEFLSPRCHPLLDELGVTAGFAELEPATVRGMELFGFGHRARGCYSGRPGSGLRRERLDALLAHAAAVRHGVEFLPEHTVTGLLRDGRGQVTGVSVQPRRGPAFMLRAAFTIGADGLRSRIANDLGALRRRRGLDRVALVTRYRDVCDSTGGELHVFQGGYFAAAPVDGGLWSLNLVVPRTVLRRHRGPLDLFFSDCLRRANLGERLAAARRVDPIRGVGPMGWSARRVVFDGAALLGDAAGFVDPISGDGVYHALHGAALLAPVLVAALQGGNHSRAALGAYAAAHRRVLAPRLGLCRALATVAWNPWLARAVLAVIERVPTLAQRLIAFHALPSAIAWGRPPLSAPASLPTNRAPGTPPPAPWRDAARLR